MPVRTISWLSIRPFEDLNFNILTIKNVRKSLRYIIIWLLIIVVCARCPSLSLCLARRNYHIAYHKFPCVMQVENPMEPVTQKRTSSAVCSTLPTSVTKPPQLVRGDETLAGSFNVQYHPNKRTRQSNVHGASTCDILGGNAMRSWRGSLSV